MGASVPETCRLIRKQGLVSAWDAAPGLGALMISGSDAPAFLQSQLTSDVLALAAGGQQWSARTDRKGRLVAWFSLHRLPERGQPFPTYLFVLPRVEIPALVQHLHDYVITEEVQLEDVSDDFEGLLIAGPRAEELVAPDTLCLSVSFTGDPGFVTLWPKSGESSVLDQPLARRALDLGFTALENDRTDARVWNSLRVEAGWPLMGCDLDSGSMVLTQTGLEAHVVSHSKGCYLGQEVLARVRTYGSAKLALRGVVLEPGSDETLDPWSQDHCPAPGAVLDTAEGKGIGRWGQNIWSVEWQAPVALVFLDRDHRTPGDILEIEAHGRIFRARVVMLPFYEAGKPEERARNLHDRAVHLFSDGHDREAAELLEQAIALDPGHADSYEALGVILGRAERYHEAIDIFHRLLEVDAQEPMVHTNLSLYYMKIGDKEQAERHRSLATVRKFSGGDQDLMRQQQELEIQQRRQEALRKRELFTEVLEMDPDDSLALMGLGNALLELEEFEEAEQWLGRAIAVQGNNSSLYLSHGKVLEKLQRADEARRVLRTGVEVASRQGDLMPLREMEHRLLLLG